MEKRLTFKRLARLTGAARRALAEVMGDHDFADEIRRGVAECWQVDPARLFLITRIEKKELVVCCAAGKSLIDACVYLLAAAKQQGLHSIRFHTEKPAFVRLITRYFPFELIEIRKGGERVLRMVIHGR